MNQINLNNFIILEGLSNTAKPSYKKPITHCIHCGEKTTTHKHCKTCKILIHKESFMCECGTAHTLTMNGSECVQCENNRLYGKKEYETSILIDFLLTPYNF